MSRGFCRRLPTFHERGAMRPVSPFTGLVGRVGNAPGIRRSPALNVPLTGRPNGARRTLKPAQTLKEAPQPQVRLTFGLRSLKPASMRLSL